MAKKSKSEERDSALLLGTETQAIESIPDYFAREARENRAAQGLSIEVFERIPPMTEDEKRQYWRDKELERIENERVERKDRAPYDGADPEGDGVFGELVEPRGTTTQL